MTQRKVGRPTKKTPALVDQVCAMLRDGVPVRRAAKWMGIGEATIRDWLKADDKDAALLREANSSLLRSSLGLIAKKIREDDREDLAQWIVERRIPEFRRPSAGDPVLDLIDEVDEDTQSAVRKIIIEGLAKKERAEA